MTARFLSTLRSDKRGAAVVELALTAPFLAALVIGVTDMARGYSLKLQLEQAAQRSIEKVEQQKSVSQSYDTGMTAEATSAMTDAGYSTGNTITPDSWVECSSNGTSWTRQTNFTDACASSEMTARYVKVTISRAFSPMFPSRHWPGANQDGSITVSGTAAVRVQ